MKKGMKDRKNSGNSEQKMDDAMMQKKPTLKKKPMKKGK